MARGWHLAVGAVSGERRTRSLAWVGSHGDGLQLVGAVVAAILLLIVSISWWSFLIIGALLLVYEVALQWAKGHTPGGGPPGTTAEDTVAAASPAADS